MIVSVDSCAAQLIASARRSFNRAAGATTARPPCVRVHRRVLVTANRDTQPARAPPATEQLSRRRIFLPLLAGVAAVAEVHPAGPAHAADEAVASSEEESTSLPVKARPPHSRASAENTHRSALFTYSAMHSGEYAVASMSGPESACISNKYPNGRQIAKLGGILLFADIVSALILGKSVLNLAKKDGDKGGGDWKDKVADSLLGSKAAEGSAAADDAAALPLAGNSTRVEGLLARVRGNRFSNGLRFKEDVIDVIDSAYAYTPTEYRSGFDTPWEVVNPAGKNEGSCKVFYFAKMHELDPKETVSLFAEFALEVEATPQGSSHANIRAFQRTGWKGIKFAGEVLSPKGAR